MSWDRELVARTDMLLTHHDRYGRGVVRSSLPDVFVIQGRPHDYDIALRLDGGYSDRGMARWVAKGWQELVDSINAIRLEHRDKIISDYHLI